MNAPLTSINDASHDGDGAEDRSGIEHLAAGAHAAIDKVKEAAKPAIDRAAVGAHKAIDAVAGAATHAADSVGTNGEHVKDTSARLMDEMRNFVRENPVATLGIALATGFVLSRIITPRR